MFEDIMFGYVLPLMTIIGSVITTVILMALIGSFMDGLFTSLTTTRPSGATYVKTPDANMSDFPVDAKVGDTHWHDGSRYIKSFRGWVLTNGAR